MAGAATRAVDPCRHGSPYRAGVGAHDMTEIEIGPDGGRPADREGTPGTDAPDRTAVRRAAVLRVLRRWWPLAAVAVLGVVGWQVVTDARERATAERHRETVGVLGATVTPRLTATPWERDGQQPALLRFGAPLADGTVVGPLSDANGVTAEVALLDPADGTIRWRTPLPEADATAAELTSPGGSSTTQCRADATDTATIWCGTLRGRAAPPVDSGAVTTLFALDAATGAVRETRTLPAGTTGAVLDGLLVTVTPAGDGALDTLDLVATEAATGGTRWTTTLTDVLPVQVLEPLALSTGPGYLVVTDGTGARALDPADGTVLAEAQRLEPARDGGLLGVSGSSGTRIVPADGGTPVDVDGVPVTLEPDDGSAPGVEVLFRPDGTLRGVLRGVDGRTGDVLWERPGPAESYAPLVLLDGVLHGDDGTAVWAVDAASGAEVWRTSTARGTSTLLTDGVSLLRLEREDSGSTVLAAYALRDGSRTWGAPLPDGVRELSAQSWTAGGALLGRTEDGDLVTLG